MNFKKFGVIALLAAAVFTSCQTEKEALEEHHFTNKLFVNADAKTNEILVKAGVPDQVRTLSVSTALKVEEPISGVFVADTNYVENYKKEFAEAEVVALPLEHVAITNPEVVIPKGSNKSSDATVTFTNISSLDRAQVYVLPVVLKNVTDINVIASKLVTYYVFRGAALVNVVCNMKDNRAGAKEWKTPEKFQNMKKFTAEALVRMNTTGPHFISTVMGTEGGYLLRFGDAGVPEIQLQIAGSPNQTNSNMQIELGKWVHIACVFEEGYTTVYFDGRVVLDKQPSGNANGVTWGAYGNDEGENNNKRYFWIGYSYESSRYFDGDMCEVRIWDHCLKAEEINAEDHFYYVDPESEGLIAYWKMDEGSGTVLKDSTPNGNDLTLRAEAAWPKVSLPVVVK